jgi:hypothetical protein
MPSTEQDTIDFIIAKPAGSVYASHADTITVEYGYATSSIQTRRDYLEQWASEVVSKSHVIYQNRYVARSNESDLSKKGRLDAAIREVALDRSRDNTFFDHVELASIIHGQERVLIY